MNDKINRLIQRLEAYGFKKIVDEQMIYCNHKKSNFYFKKKEEGYTEFNQPEHYVILSHHNQFKKLGQSFDLWISTYNSANDIGIKPPIDKILIIGTFNIDTDWRIVARYFT